VDFSPGNRLSSTILGHRPGRLSTRSFLSLMGQFRMMLTVWINEWMLFDHPVFSLKWDAGIFGTKWQANLKF